MTKHPRLSIAEYVQLRDSHFYDFQASSEAIPFEFIIDYGDHAVIEFIGVQFSGISTTSDNLYGLIYVRYPFTVRFKNCRYNFVMFSFVCACVFVFGSLFVFS